MFQYSSTQWKQKLFQEARKCFLLLGVFIIGWRTMGSQLTSAFFSDLDAGQGRHRTTVTPTLGHQPLTFFVENLTLTQPR